MRALGLGMMVLVATVGVYACGGDDGGKSRNNPGSGGQSDAGLEELAPEIGVCRKMCCDSTDCAAGETCTPFEAASGTLGVCSGAWAGDGGAAEAGSPSPDGGATLPSGCWTKNEALCNPVTGQGCLVGEACDYAHPDPLFEPAVDCFDGDNTQGPGEECDNALGPYCQPGYHCAPN